MFYSVAIYLLLVVLGFVPFSVSGLIKSFLVFTLRRYWFVTAYPLLLIVSPLLNHAIANMDRRAHAARAAIVYVSCICIMVGERALAYWLTPAIFGMPQLTSLFYPYNSVTNVIGSIAFFLIFLKISSVGRPLTKFLQLTAPVSFAAYLIHEHPMLRPVLWDWLTPYAYEQSVWLIPYMILCVTDIFLSCCMVEHLRLWVLRITHLDVLISSSCDWITRHFEPLLDRALPHTAANDPNTLTSKEM